MVNETEGVVQLELVLSVPSSTNLTVQISEINSNCQTANCK